MLAGEEREEDHVSSVFCYTCLEQGVKRKLTVGLNMMVCSCEQLGKVRRKCQDLCGRPSFETVAY